MTDYSADKTANMEFIESLSSEQQMFFDSLEIDLTKADADQTIYEIPEDEETSTSKYIDCSSTF